MNENLNLVEILKDCPEGTKLYSTVFGDVEFMKVFQEKVFYPIEIKLNNNLIENLTKDGRMFTEYSGECVLFPSKDQRDWSKFNPPCEFKDGDILSYQSTCLKNRTIYIYRYHEKYNTAYYVALRDGVNETFIIDNKGKGALNGYNSTVRFATEEEKQKLFDAIKLNGYKWNTETKTLEKLVEPRFKVGDWIASNLYNSSDLLRIIGVDETKYEVVMSQGSTGVPPIWHIDKHFHLWTIQDVNDGDVLYSLDSNQPFIYKERNDYEQATAYCGLNMYGKFFVWGTKDCAITLNNYVPATKEQCDALMKAMNGAGYEWDGEKKELKKLKKPKFDPKTLQAFDKVLGRNQKSLKWKCQFFSNIRKNNNYPYVCIGYYFKYCIPYNDDTKHLVGTTEEAPEFYRYWED